MYIKTPFKMKNKIHRRDFIKKSGTALVGGALLSNPIASRAFTFDDAPIKIALIGCGGRGTGAVVNAFNTGQNIQLVAMADAFEDKVREAHGRLEKKYGDKVDVPKVRQYVGFDAYKKAINDADVVFLTTPPGFRPYHFEEAVKQGKQIFMEKPVAVDVPGINKVLENAKEAKRKKLNVVVGLQRRYQKSYREAFKRIRNGEIGDIVAGQVYWNSGGVWVNEREPQQNEMEYQMRNWYYFNWLCGDHIVEQHVHNIDIANWLKDAYPVSIQGVGSRAHRIGVDYGEIYDNFSIEMTYADGSVVSSQAAHFEGSHTRVDETFQGTKGRVYLSSDNKAILWDANGNEIYNHDGKDDPNPYDQEHVGLFKAIRDGEYKFNNAEYAAYSTLTGIIGRAACYTGKVIKWEDALKSEVTQMPENIDWNTAPIPAARKDGLYPAPIPGKNTSAYI